MSVRVSSMSLDDCDGVQTLWRRCDDGRLRDDDYREHLARQLVRNPGLSCAAEVGEQFVGAIHCLQNGRRGIIRHPAIDPSHRWGGFFVLRENPDMALSHKLQLVEGDNLCMLAISLGQ